MPRSHWQGPDAKDKIGVKKGNNHGILMGFSIIKWDFHGIIIHFNGILMGFIGT
jgi:hypothetical protein